ncbi:MAG: CCA tRNA nucleotidyltransferase, partial [Candidatus Hydrogenedentes bacterium]|nr:CCA tRNA nucleotidyltransferase [Candidatus Hydrogenedentota bacterium]
PRDYDVATNARPAEVMALFEHTVPLGEAFGVVLAVFPEGTFEVATFRRDGPYDDGRHPVRVEYVDEEADARRRDFTVNAMFYDPAAGAVLDYVGGQADLRAGVIRTVGEPAERFEEDHLRLLRGVRFAARLGYAIAPETFAAMRASAPSIRRTSPERVRDELLKILTEGGARRAFELLDETGLLEHVLPEVARMKGVEQPEEFHPEGDVFTHTLLMLDEMTDPSPALAMGVLLHDAGKPHTQTVEDRIRFNNHDQVGAEEARKVCRRLRMPNAATERIVYLVGEHMRLANAPKMRESKLKRFVREDGFPELLELCRLDCLASHRDLQAIQWLEHYVSELRPEEVKPAPLLNGKDLLAMGYRPGPLFSEILTAVEDAQLEGRITGPAQARAFVAAGWPLPHPDSR